MFQHVEYAPVGVCTQKISFDLVDGYLHHVRFTGGCSGNTKGVALLAEGQNAREVARRLKGVPCRDGNSCPNQFAIAIEQAISNQGEA